jgi:hypothetical protein
VPGVQVSPGVLLYALDLSGFAFLQSGRIHSAVFAQTSAEAQTLLERIEQLSLDQLFAHLLQTLQGLDRLVNAPEVFAVLRALGRTLATLQRRLSPVDGQVAGLLDEMEGTATTTPTVLTDIR